MSDDRCNHESDNCKCEPAAAESLGAADGLEHLCYVYLRHMKSVFDLGRLAEDNKATLATFIRARELALRQRIIDLEMELARLRVKPIVDSEIKSERRG